VIFGTLGLVVFEKEFMEVCSFGDGFGYEILSNFMWLGFKHCHGHEFQT